MLESARHIIRETPLGRERHTHPVEVAQAFRLRPAPTQARCKLRLREDDLSRVPEVAGYTLTIPLNTFAGDRERMSTRLGPDEWLLHAPEGDADTLAMAVTTILGDIPHALVDLSHGHAGLHLEGTKAADILNAGCPLDLAAQSFPTGAATRTLLGKVEIILWRRSDTPIYAIECGRSFAPYVWDFLAEAGREYR